MTIGDTTAPHHERDPRVEGQSLASDIDRASVPGDGTAGVEGGQPRSGARVEAAVVDPQDLDDLAADLVDQFAARGSAGGDRGSGAQHAVEVPLLLAGPGLFPTAPQGYLGERGPDQ